MFVNLFVIHITNYSDLQEGAFLGHGHCPISSPSLLKRRKLLLKSLERDKKFKLLECPLLSYQGMYFTETWEQNIIWGISTTCKSELTYRTGQIVVMDHSGGYNVSPLHPDYPPRSWENFSQRMIQRDERRKQYKCPGEMSPCLWR